LFFNDKVDEDSEIVDEDEDEIEEFFKECGCSLIVKVIVFEINFKFERILQIKI